MSSFGVDFPMADQGPFSPTVTSNVASGSGMYHHDDLKGMQKLVTNGLSKDVSNHVPHKTKSGMSSSSKSDIKLMKPGENKDNNNKVHSHKTSSSKHHEDKVYLKHSSSSKENSSKIKSIKHSDSSKHKEKSDSSKLKEKSQDKEKVNFIGHKTKEGSVKSKESSIKPKDSSYKSSDGVSSKSGDSAKKDFKSKDNLKSEGTSKKEGVNLKENKEIIKPKKEEEKIREEKHRPSEYKEHESKELNDKHHGEKSKHSSSSEKLKTGSNKFKDISEKEKIKVKENNEKNKLKNREHGEKKDVSKELEEGRAGGDTRSEVKKKVVHSDKIERSSHIVKEESPLKIKIKREPEGSVSDDDVPLAVRTVVTEKTKEVKIKRERDGDSDDEPLAARAEKVKKIKVEHSEERIKIKTEKKDKHHKEAENRKRKTDVEDLKPIKKVKKEDKKIKKESTQTSDSRKTGKEKEEQDVWKWWEEEKHAEGVKWKTLQHNGPVLAPSYEPLPKSVKFYYEGKHMVLSPEAEEVAGFYARMLEHDYVTKDIFNKNFFKDWRKVMTQEEKGKITDLKKCNFRELAEYFKVKSEERKSMSKEEKAEIKKKNENIQKEYGFCIIDGHKQKIGNFKIEPPGLFRGRGEHPKMGMLKKRVRPEDIIINIGREAVVPKPPEGRKWKEVRHDNTVTWLACWNENILGATKYIMLNPSSKLKGEKDWQKYETARKLYKHVDRIRNEYREDWKSKEMRVRQRAVALYFIDKLALRAGNEKEEGESADTVGCCSLRVEHITLHDEKDGKEFVVEFDFLGKDSIRYVNTIPVEKRVFKNLKLFMENKQPGDDLFDRLNTSILNKYLNELMEGLTAKVFRTFNASRTLQEQLNLLTEENMSIPEKILAYNRANRAVAILCNHQRAVPKTFDKSMQNLKSKIDEKEKQIKDFKKELKKVKQAYKESNASKDKILLDRKKKRMAQLEDQLRKLEVQATDKEENKQIALSTSKLNYLDPRISVAWCKKWDVPIEKIYNKTQREKFLWAIEMAGPDFQF